MSRNTARPPAVVSRPDPDRHWRDRAACRGSDPALWFEADGERAAARSVRVEMALAYCHHCPVVLECASSQLAHGDEFGVWGAVDVAEVRSALADSKKPLKGRQRGSTAVSEAVAA